MNLYLKREILLFPDGMARARVPIRYRKNNIIVTLTYIVTMMFDINVIFEFLIFSKSLEFNTFYLVRYRRSITEI